MKDKKRILIIDDEESFTRLLKLNLHHTGHYTARAGILAGRHSPGCNDAGNGWRRSGNAITIESEAQEYTHRFSHRGGEAKRGGVAQGIDWQSAVCCEARGFSGSRRVHRTTDAAAGDGRGSQAVA
jgi:hypothetical protein